MIPVATSTAGQHFSTRFLHLSDPHLTSLAAVGWRQLLSKRILGFLSWSRRRRHEHRGEVLEALLRRAAAMAVDQKLVTGDLTQIGLPEEFREAAQWLSTLGSPEDVCLVPGNHDTYVAAPWRDSFAHWLPYLCGDPLCGDASSDPCSNKDTAAEAQHLDDLFPQLRVRGGIAFIGLSSAVPTAPFIATGRLGGPQIERLATVLEHTAALGLFRVVHLHHPLSVSGEKWRKRLVDTEAFEAVLARHGAELVLHGHRHRSIHAAVPGPRGPIPVIGAASASAVGDHAEAAAFSVYSVQGNARDGWQLDADLWRWQSRQGDFSSERQYRWQIAGREIRAGGL